MPQAKTTSAIKHNAENGISLRSRVAKILNVPQGYACGFGSPAASRAAVLSIVYGWIKGE